ncbi:MAG: type II secretion system F family protein [Actinomycetes bacterium]
MTVATSPLAFGLGALLVLWWIVEPQRSARSRRSRLTDLLTDAGLGHISARRLLTTCAALGGTVGLVVYIVSDSVVIGVAIGLVVSPLPVAWVGYVQRNRQAELRQIWPDAIEHLASGIRAGLALPEAISQLRISGPEELQPAFTSFAATYRSSGRFSESLDVLKVALSDPVGDRVVETLRLARDVGGSDLGRLLRTLSAFLRDDARVRGELESRQSWTVNAARLAVAAPWVLLLLLGTRPSAAAAYNSSAGAAVLVFGAVVSFVAYRLMMRIGRLPTELRVLR